VHTIFLKRGWGTSCWCHRHHSYKSQRLRLHRRNDRLGTPRRRSLEKPTLVHAKQMALHAEDWQLRFRIQALERRWAAPAPTTGPPHTCHRCHSPLEAAAPTSRQGKSKRKASQTHRNKKPTNKVLPQPNHHSSSSSSLRKPTRGNLHTTKTNRWSLQPMHNSKNDAPKGGTMQNRRHHPISDLGFPSEVVGRGGSFT
jgi:hypothetical protein